MKNTGIKKSYLIAVLLLAGFASLLSSCKDTAPDPSYVDFGLIRIMEFVQCDPIQIDLITDGTTDTVHLTPTAMTYGVATPYVNNLPTARGAGQKYHLVARLAGPKTVIAEDNVTLFPGDKYTWVIFNNDKHDGGPNPKLLVRDNPATATDNSYSYFRFMNTNADEMIVKINDPISGDALGGAIAGMNIGNYIGLKTKTDTTVTFFVVRTSDGAVMGRLAGVSLGPGEYHTITWGGQLDSDCRKTDINGDHVLDDTLRVHLYDDNTSGTDLLPVQQTLRFNVVNALVPPAFPTPLLVNYMDPNSPGMAIVINNNTVYDFQGLKAFQAAPGYQDGGTGIWNAYPKSLPLNSLTYFKTVRPIGQNPSSGDSILFRFYANSQVIVSDQLMSVVIYDTVKKFNASQAIPYDSAAGVTTIMIPDEPQPNNAIIVLANTTPAPYKGTSVTGQKFYVNGTLIPSIKASSLKNSAIIRDIPADGSPTTVTGSWSFKLSGNDTPVDISTTFTPEKGGIYEVLAVGRGNDPNGYTPHFMVIRTNPK